MIIRALVILLFALLSTEAAERPFGYPDTPRRKLSLNQGYAYGEGVIGLDGLDLTFTKLPAGDYQLTTWHHAP